MAQRLDLATIVSNADAATTFWANVDRRGEDECWHWTGPKTRLGYGNFYYRGALVIASRASIVLTTGELPNGRMALHSCDNPPCVNPKHLRWGTARDNVDDRQARGRQNNRIKTHCVHGHPFSGDNLRIEARGPRWRRTCGACSAEACRRKRARKREQRIAQANHGGNYEQA